MPVAARKRVLVTVNAQSALHATNPRVVLSEVDEIRDHRLSRNRLRAGRCVQPWLLPREFTR